MKTYISVIPLFLIGFAFFFGCKIGGSLKNEHVANSPSGDRIMVTLEEQSQTLNGELLSVHDESVIMLTGELEIVEVFYSKAKRMLIGKKRIFLSGRPYSGLNEVTKFRVYARFPQGISEELMASLLLTYNLEEIKVLK
jgi:hypothetical protein